MDTELPPAAARRIAALRLETHPEGGHYREIFRSSATVQPEDGRPGRAALTTILFLLARGEFSCWHRVASDEAWHHHEGDALELIVATPDFTSIETAVIGGSGDGVAPVHVVPARHWQAARPLGDYTLIGCTVAPGFDFADFVLLRDYPEEEAVLRARHPEFARFL